MLPLVFNVAFLKSKFLPQPVKEVTRLFMYPGPRQAYQITKSINSG
uniref:ATGSL03 (GLUCAN SYNTHASE-LIKE 3) n=1 Tax=Arundo donax TaxID=35708 RepID=A0A0A8XX80_ARUDO